MIHLKDFPMKKKGAKKTSTARGVRWSKREERWIVQIRKAKIQRICHTEIEAVVHYNEAAKVLWPGCKLNDLNLFRQNNCNNKAGERAIDLTEGREVIVDKAETREIKYYYNNLKDYGWFFRDGRVQTCVYKPEEKGFIYIDLAGVIYGGPVKFANGNPLDCRWKNLITVKQEELIPAKCGAPAPSSSQPPSSPASIPPAPAPAPPSPPPEKTSAALGVSWSEQRKQWIMSVRRTEIPAIAIQKVCNTEIEAVCHYNAVASVIWPGTKLNKIDQFRHNEGYDPDGRKIIDVGENNMIVNFNTDPSPVNYDSLRILDLFYRDDWVQQCWYDRVNNTFVYRKLAEVIHKGPVAFANGNRLDYRWKNLIDPRPAFVMEDEEEPEPVELVPGSAEMVDVCSPEYMESLAKGSTPKPAKPVSKEER